MESKRIRTLKIFDLAQANRLIQFGANVLSVNVDRETNRTWVKFEADQYFNELMIKWKKKEI